LLAEADVARCGGRPSPLPSLVTTVLPPLVEAVAQSRCRARVLRPGERRFDAKRGQDGDAPPALHSDEFCPRCRADGHAGWQRGACRRCGYVHKRLRVPTIASLLAAAFRRGVICVGELCQIRGDDSLRSRAVRALRARHPLGATGTPSRTS
jgi:hypothetical protein